MPAPDCPRCGAPLHEAARFCTACGAPAGGGTAAPGGPLPPAPALRRPAPEPQLLHCPACEASNAASRSACGRCGADLRSGGWATRDEALAPQPDHVAATQPRETSGAALAVIVLAGLAVLGVLATILSARGVGLFGAQEPAGPPSPAAVEIVSASASSELPASGDLSHGPENLLDGDPATAWVAGASGGEAGEWVELRLAAPAPVTRLVLWNGYQRENRFRDYGRLARLRLLLGEQSLSADILDVEGRQAIDLPEPVVTDTVRMEILCSRAGSRHEEVAVSGIDVIAASPQDEAQGRP